MNHTPAINVWKGSNRVSRLWEDLLIERVSPDPIAYENVARGEKPERSFLMEPMEIEVDAAAAGGEQNETAEPGLLERAGFESLRMIRQALEILAAPPAQEPVTDTGWMHERETLPANQMGWTDSVVRSPLQIDATGIVFIKVSSEPELQPGSSIDTRRMAYGLKIPMRPLHKRPVYQRVFFWLRHLTNGRRDVPASH